MVKRDQETSPAGNTGRHFLVGRTGSKLQEAIHPGSPFAADLSLGKFPNLLTGLKFLEYSEKMLEGATRFTAMMIRIDNLLDQSKGDSENKPSNSVMTVAAVIEKESRRQNGIWGLLSHGLFGCYFQNINDSQGVGIAEKMQRLLSDDSGCSISAGIAVYPTCHFQKNQILENARKALDHADFFGPGSIVTFDSISLNISGDQLYQAGDIQGAMTEFRDALTLDPLNINAHNSLGVCYGEMGMLPEALESFETALRIDTREIMAAYNAGLILLQMGNKEKALEYLVEANRIEPNVFEVLLETGKLYMEKQEYDKARDCFEKAVSLNPKAGHAFRFLGECRVASHDDNGAAQAFKKAVKLNPNDAVSLSALGDLFDRMGENLEIAMTFCKQSVDISPDNGLFRHRLACLYLKNDRIDDALKEFENASRLGCDASKYIDKIHLQKSNGLKN